MSLECFLKYIPLFQQELYYKFFNIIPIHQVHLAFRNYVRLYHPN
jgi:hypothetical protein